MPRPYTDLNNDIKPWLGINVSYTDEDAILTIMRDSVEQAVINYIENDFDLHTVTNEIIDSNGSDIIIPRFEPLVSVQAIYVNVKTDGSEGSLLDQESYHVTDESSGSVIKLKHYRAGRGRSNIRIDYTYGYSSVPPDVFEAILLSIEAKFRRKDRKSIGLNGRSKKDESESYSNSMAGWDKKVGLPTEVVSMLNTYRKFEFPTQPMATRNP